MLLPFFGRLIWDLIKGYFQHGNSHKGSCQKMHVQDADWIELKDDEK